MSESTSAQLALDFSDNWQSWLVIRHFLPASMQRALVLQILHSVTGGRLSLGDLFEEVWVEAPLWNECWAVRPLQGIKGTAAGLQEWARGLVWQNDDHQAFGRLGETPEEGYVGVGMLELLTRLGSADLGSFAPIVELFPEQAGDGRQPTLQQFLRALEIAKEGHTSVDSDPVWRSLAGAVGNVPMPLRAVMLKHVSDLFADADAWSHALRGYKEVGSLLDQWEEPSTFCELKRIWKTIATHSQATATGIVDGAATSATALVGAIQSVELKSDPTLAMNLGLDAARSWDKVEQSYRDPRVAFLSSPLLLQAHDASPALRYSANGKYRDASRRFWALLRRQIALGAAQEVRATKASYARNILAAVAEKVEEQDAASDFSMAIRLLIESGQPELVERIAWSRAFIEAYVTKEDLVIDLVSRANAHPGAKLERTKVLVQLFKTWTKALSPSHDSIAIAMWEHIAEVANSYDAEFSSEADAGRPALKALLQLAKDRPELRAQVAPKAAVAICSKLRGSFKWGQVDAIEAALAYVEAFSMDALLSVVVVLLETLEAEDPTIAFWPLSRAGLRFLVDHRVRERCRGVADIDVRSLEQILRFGLAEDEAQPVVFFHLADFDADLLEQEGVKERLAGVLGRVLRAALQVNSSSVTDNIQALLIAPAVAGPEGIRTAIDGISRVIRSVSTPHPSMGLSNLDRVLLVLTEELENIRRVCASSLAWLEADLHRLVEAILELWAEAARRPLVFAPFALPPRTKPSSVLVHNCAFASLRFARALGEEGRVLEALGKASENAELRGAIILARATRGSGQELTQDDLEVPQVHDREAFYPAVGRRLAQLQRLPKEDAVILCKGLIQNCLRLGPDPADAALLVAAANLELHDFVRECGLNDYIGRVRAERGNRLLLQPILELFRSA
jgi:hypothetical protein